MLSVPRYCLTVNLVDIVWVWLTGGRGLKEYMGHGSDAHIVLAGWYFYSNETVNNTIDMT